jgi:hypothetical protein
MVTRVFLLVICLAIPYSSFTKKAVGQIVSGTVLDELTELPITDAVVTLVRQEDRDTRQQATDLSGYFELPASGPGTYMIYFSHLSYEHSGGGPFELVDVDTLRLQIFLMKEAVMLDEVTVEAESMLPHLAAVGFYNRKNVGWGEFIMREDIVKKQAFQPSDLFTGLKSTVVLRREGADEIYSSRRNTCLMTVIIDGSIVFTNEMTRERRGRRPLHNMSIDGLVAVDNIEAIEVYGSPQGIPQQWQRQSPCGAVLIWTRR